MMNHALPALSVGVGQYASSFPSPYISRGLDSTLPIVGGITATHPKIMIVIMRVKRLSVLPMVLVKLILVKLILVKPKKTVPKKVVSIQENILA